MKILDRVSWTFVVLLAVTLGLAPFAPEPHVWEKLKMLWDGDLVRPVDWFDLGLHGTPWVLLALKTLRFFSLRQAQDTE